MRLASTRTLGLAVLTPAVALLLARAVHRSLRTDQLATTGDLVGNGLALVIAAAVFLLLTAAGFTAAAITARSTGRAKTKIDVRAALEASRGER